MLQIHSFKFDAIAPEILKAHLKQLQQRGHLKIQGQGKGTRYTIG